MEKIKSIALGLCVLMSCAWSDATGSIPGKGRIGWIRGFSDFKEASAFVCDLEKTGRNGDFHFGFSHFDLPDDYRLYEFDFRGLIGATKEDDEEDIFKCTYSVFYIQYVLASPSLKRESDNKIYVYFYPFSNRGTEFSKDQISFIQNTWSFESGTLSFGYEAETVLGVRLETDMQAYGRLDKDSIVSQLSQNFELAV